MSVITHSGYGYSKILCESVASWFINEFFPRHKLTVDIVHRGLKREEVHGYCDVVGDTQRPRHFLIELDTHMDKELYVKTLFHELTHMKQWVDGLLRSRYGKLCYSKEPVDNYEYWYQPHEVEARYMEEELYHDYLIDRGLVTVDEVIQHFPNRLMQVV